MEYAFEPEPEQALSAQYFEQLKQFKEVTNNIKKKASASSVTTVTSIAKSFVADNGIRYVWDEDEQDWVEGDDDDDSVNDHDEEVYSDEGSDDELNRRIKKPKTNNDTTDNKDVKPKRIRKNKSKKNKKVVNNWVYVTGLPSDITEEELKDHFSKVGMIAINPMDQTRKIKIYKDGDLCKGDGSLCYASAESAKMAIEILHEGYIRLNNQISVTKAEFNAPATSNNDAKVEGKGAQQAKRPQLTKAQISVANSATKQALSWNDAEDLGVSSKTALKIVVLQGMFSPHDLVDDEAENTKVLKELEEDIVQECTEKCGVIDKITIFSKHPKGIIVVKFNTAYAADECIKLMEGRYYNKIKLRCYYWDGTTNFNLVAIDSSSAQLKETQRLEEFGHWLENEQEALPEEFALRTE